MTSGEKMVWAAAFAKFYDIGNPPREVIHDSSAWAAWESAQTHAAIEYAGGAVERLREEVKAIEDGFGKRSPIAKMLREMVKR